MLVKSDGIADFSTNPAVSFFCHPTCHSHSSLQVCTPADMISYTQVELDLMRTAQVETPGVFIMNRLSQLSGDRKSVV